MTVVKLRVPALVGLAVEAADIEVDLLRRLPGVCIVGLPAGSVRELAERVRSAITAAGYEFPRKRVVVNLSPAGSRRSVPASLDLPIALAILAADGQISLPKGFTFLGELSLSGEIRYCRGTVAAAEWAQVEGVQLVTSAATPWPKGIPGTLPAHNLQEVCLFLQGKIGYQPPAVWVPVPEPHVPWDLGDVSVTPAMKRALLISIAGGHDLLMVGPPGTGKTALARRAHMLLPPLSADDVQDIIRTSDLAGLTPTGATPFRVGHPFRAPHHSCSVAGLVGKDRPGELDLADHGVLLLDEAENFPRVSLEAVRAHCKPHTHIIYAAGAPPEDEEDRELYWRSLRRNVPVALAVRSYGKKDPTPTPWMYLQSQVAAAWKALGREQVWSGGATAALPADPLVLSHVRDVAKTIAALSEDSGVVLAEHVTEAQSYHPSEVLC